MSVDSEVPGCTGHHSSKAGTSISNKIRWYCLFLVVVQIVYNCIAVYYNCNTNCTKPVTPTPKSLECKERVRKHADHDDDEPAHASGILHFKNPESHDAIYLRASFHPCFIRAGPRHRNFLVVGAVSNWCN
eukprot:1285977-Rhodomonas_salina.2